jgi:hypothetical protein
MRRQKTRSIRRQKEKRTSPAAYPDPKTWREIVAQRNQILRDFLFGLAEESPDIAHDLIKRYGHYQVRYVLEKYQEFTRPSFLVDEATIYRHYRWLFAQFGGDRPFLSKQAYDAAIQAEIKDPEKVQRMVLGISAPDDIMESDRLIHLNYATDITPPAVPPKPADFAAPAPHRYSYPLKLLLNLGWQLNESAIAPHLARMGKWRKVLPELSQMITDPGLLRGWPGEKASWAPYHALTLLGQAQQPELAAGLLDLLLEENDWLSDRLPDIWAQMGPESAVPLWQGLQELAYEDDKLGVLVAGLLKIAQSYPDQFEATVRQFSNMLVAGTAERADLNAYIAYALDELGDETAVPAIENALDEGRINRHIMGLDSIKLLGATYEWE